MIKKIFTLAFCITIALPVFAQWEVGLGAGAALPVTGLGEVFKTGWLLSVEGKYRFGEGHFAAGLQSHWTRIQHDKNPDDQFENARLTVVPIIFFVEYEFLNGKFRPFISGGLGASLFNASYNLTLHWEWEIDTTITSGISDFNASFTMLPRIGFRYSVNQHLFTVIEGNLVLLANGSTMFSPRAYAMTGYVGITAGLCYRFGKKPANADYHKSANKKIFD